MDEGFCPKTNDSAGGSAVKHSFSLRGEEVQNTSGGLSLTMKMVIRNETLNTTKV